MLDVIGILESGDWRSSAWEMEAWGSLSGRQMLLVRM